MERKMLNIGALAVVACLLGIVLMNAEAAGALAKRIDIKLGGREMAATAAPWVPGVALFEIDGRGPVFVTPRDLVSGRIPNTHRS